MFIPSAEGHDDTSYFMSRYIWNPEDEHCLGGSDFDEISGSGSSGSGSAVLDEDVRILSTFTTDAYFILYYVLQMVARF